MKNETIKAIIVATNGRFFTATFTKKDGTQRTMNCRAGVKKYLKGVGRSNPIKDNLISVYDVKAKGYRYINLDTLQSLNIDHAVITVKS